MIEQKISNYIKERNDAFESDDYEWFARQANAVSGKVISAEVAVIGFHKARIECIDVSENKRRESLTWLAERGYKRLNGSPISVGDELPE